MEAFLFLLVVLMGVDKISCSLGRFADVQSRKFAGCGLCSLLAWPGH